MCLSNFGPTRTVPVNGYRVGDALAGGGWLRRVAMAFPIVIQSGMPCDAHQGVSQPRRQVGQQVDFTIAVARCIARTNRDALRLRFPVVSMHNQPLLAPCACGKGLR